MKGYARFCYGLFGWLGRLIARKKPEVEEILTKARMDMTAEVYYATAVTNTLLITFIGTFAIVMVDFFLSHLILVLAALILIYISPVLLILLVYYHIIIFLLLLLVCKIYFFGVRIGGHMIGHAAYIKRKHRAKIVDRYLPYAASFVAAMAASNATVQVIMKGLAGQKKKCTFWERVITGKPERSVYPEIDLEATAIYNDIKVLGLDTVTAIRSGVKRAPSSKLAEFLQGIYSTVTSGGNLKLYFLNAAEKYMEDNKQEQRVFLDQLALTVESYIVIAIAMPIFLIIMLVITMWVSGSGGGGDTSANQLYLIIFGLLPLIHSSFAAGLYSKAKKT